MATPLTAGDGVSDATFILGWDGSAVQTRNFGSAIIGVAGLSGDSIAIKCSISGQNPSVLAITDLSSITGTLLAAITADGHYLVPAAALISYVKTGSASTPAINLQLKR